MTNLILLIGAGLFSRSIGNLQGYRFNKLSVFFSDFLSSLRDADCHNVLILRLGSDIDDSIGNGPGSYDVRGNVWHLECCSPENGKGWMVFTAIFGWSNNGTLGQRQSFVISSGFDPLNWFAIFRYDPWVCFLLDRRHSHFVRLEAKRYIVCSDVIARRVLSSSTENKARSQI